MKIKKQKLKSPRQLLRNDLVTVARFGNSMEAQLARTKLQSQKIESYVFDENMISMMPVYDLALGGVRLKVGEIDLDEASKVLGELNRGNFWAPRKMVFFTIYFRRMWLEY